MRLLLTPLKLLGAAILIVGFGAGIPFFWVWVGSQLQGGTAPSLAGLGVALLGIALSYSLLAVVFAWLKERLQPTPGPARHDWNRSLSAERLRRGQNTHALDDLLVTVTILVGIVCTIWFFLFGSPGVPIAP